MAYQSDETGQFEVYVRPFPEVEEGQWQISKSGGVQPLWGPDGRELFYVAGQKLMVVPVRTDVTFTAGNAEVVFEWPHFGPYGRNFDITPDGRRFLMSKPLEPADETAAPTQIHLVLNWFQELKRLSRTY